MERLLAENGLERVNLMDNDAKFVKSRQGVAPGYNVQTVGSPLKVTETENRRDVRYCN